MATPLSRRRGVAGVVSFTVQFTSADGASLRRQLFRIGSLTHLSGEVENEGDRSLRCRWHDHAFMRTAAPEGTTVAVAPEPGLLAGEVDMAGVAAHDDGSVEALESLTKTYRVATPVPHLTLAPVAVDLARRLNVIRVRRPRAEARSSPSRRRAPRRARCRRASPPGVRPPGRRAWEPTSSKRSHDTPRPAVSALPSDAGQPACPLPLLLRLSARPCVSTRARFWRLSRLRSSWWFWTRPWSTSRCRRSRATSASRSRASRGS
jgi:hypothetical protein